MTLSTRAAPCAGAPLRAMQQLVGGGSADISLCDLDMLEPGEPAQLLGHASAAEVAHDVKQADLRAVFLRNVGGEGDRLVGVL